MGFLCCCFKKNQTDEQQPLVRSGSEAALPELKNVEAKVVLLGDSGVGKSSMAMRYVEDKFDENEKSVTIGGAYLPKVVPLSNGRSVKLHIWDTGGDKRFEKMTHIFYKDADAAIIVYDVSEAESLNVAKKRIEELAANPENKGVYMAVVANKSDKTPANRFIVDQGKRLAEESKAIFKMASAKTGEGITELFKQVVDAMYIRKSKR